MLLFTLTRLRGRNADATFVAPQVYNCIDQGNQNLVSLEAPERLKNALERERSRVPQSRPYCKLLEANGT